MLSLQAQLLKHKQHKLALMEKSSIGIYHHFTNVSFDGDKRNTGRINAISAYHAIDAQTQRPTNSVRLMTVRHSMISQGNVI